MHRAHSIPKVTRFANLALTLAASTAIACSSESTKLEPGDAIVGEIDQPLWQVTGATKWPTGFIHVCFQSTHFSSTVRTKIRNVIEDGWEKAAEINFWDWGNCPSLDGSTTNLVVLINDPNMVPEPAGVRAQSMHCTNGGTASCGGNAGMAPAGDYNKIRFRSNNPTNYDILHEFGHVLGFEHEGVDQFNGDCSQRTTGGISLENEGDAANSIMGCFGGSTLSTWDILGARMAYGLKISGSIQGRNNLCLNINGASEANGATIMGFPCHGVFWNQRWFRNPPSLLARAAAPIGTSRCLNVAGGVVNSGFTPLISWDCSDSFQNELVHFTGVQWRAMGNKCLQAESNATGAKISLQACGTSSLQKWDFFEGDSRIRLNGTGQCVNVPNSVTTNGTELILWPCSTGTPFPNEVFQFSDGMIAFGGKNFNVAGGTTTNGNRLILWTPVGTHNDRFTIKGQIRMLGQCIDMQDPTAPELTPMGVRPCVSSGNQLWEYYW